MQSSGRTRGKPERPDRHVLTLNAGSSSLKAGPHRAGDDEPLVLAVDMDRIGSVGERPRVRDARGALIAERQGDLPDYQAVLATLFAALGRHASTDQLVAVGHLLEQKKMTPRAVSTLLDEQSGLLGISGTSHDMRDLLAIEATDPRAADAVALFCYRAKKYLGAFASVMGGVDVLVFTGGIGENGAVIRERICAGQEFLGIDLDPAANAANAPVISSRGSAVTVRVIPTNEERMIARHTIALLGLRQDNSVAEGIHV